MKRTLLALGLMLGTATMGVGTAMAAGIDGTGSIGTCPIIGQIKVKPALVNGGSSPANLKVKAKLSGACSGASGDGASVTSFKAKGTASTTTNNCSNLIGTTTSNLTLTVKWKGSEKLNPSTIAFTMQTGGISSDSNHGSFDLSGTVTAGSFNGNNVTAHIETDQDLSTLGGECGGKGIKKITFGLNGASNTSL